MVSFFKEVGWNALEFAGGCILLTVAVVLAIIVIAPCLAIPCMIVCYLGCAWYGYVLGIVAMMLYWALVCTICSAIWRKITGRPKLKRGQIYIEYAESGERS